MCIRDRYGGLQQPSMLSVRLHGQSEQRKVALPVEGSTMSQLIRKMEMEFDLPRGAVTGVLWDDCQERGTKIRRDREIERLRDGDEVCLVWNPPRRMKKKQEDRPWYVVKQDSYPSLREIQKQLEEVRGAHGKKFRDWAWQLPRDAALDALSISDPTWLEARVRH
eukprot:TRINITY_DN644_c0_g1_i17.p2 TRINITY_DN644_c0_g1~~TRINITY_DN644_c0_g1_i17.p2  ORF type:complete len:165 (+),score=44.03 TRINITY_DN644_c0_g1_i17:136-630(+)